tara:strand:- start:80547 stop:81758 length:1212 start_codon:yes stop_codon:yes gene_type:complete
MHNIPVYSTIQNARLEYVLHFVFTEVLKCGWHYVENKSRAAIVFGEKEESKCSFQASIMIEEGRFPKTATFKDGKLYFNSESFFDPFSAIFYCLSRMEELNAPLDVHDRFSGDTSVFFGQWETPWVDVWIEDLKHQLGIDYKPGYNFLLTVDLDFGYRFLGKGFVRGSLAFVRDAITLRWKLAKQRLTSVVSKNDPLDGVYSWLTNRFQSSNLQFFALMAPFGQFDKGLNPNSSAWKRLKKQLSGYPVGLHPSYEHCDKKKRLAEGLVKLQSHGFDVVANRFHFLRFRVEKDYRRLLDLGITNDYSMGFANRIGFRAQTSHAFYFYDLKKEEHTRLKIHPFVCMDAVYCNYLSLTSKEMQQKVVEISDKVSALGGTVCLLWHEHTLVEGTETRMLLEEILREI